MSTEAVREGVSGAESAHKLLVIAALGCLLFGLSQEPRATPYADALREANSIPRLLEQLRASHEETLQKFYDFDGTRADIESQLAVHYDISRLNFVGLNDQFSMPVYQADQKAPVADIYHYLLLAPKFERLIAFKVDHTSFRTALDNFYVSNGAGITGISNVYFMAVPENHDRCELSVSISAQVNGKQHILAAAPLPPQSNEKIVSSKDLALLKEKPLHVPEGDRHVDQPVYSGPPIHVYCSGIERPPTDAATQLMVKSGLVSIDPEGDVDAFPALRRVWNTVKDLDLGNLIAALSVQAIAEQNANESKLSVAGLDVNSRFVRIVAPLALAGLVLYLHAYLRNLRDAIRGVPATAYPYPWIRLLTTRSYGPIMAATVLALPIASTVSLFLHFAFLTTFDVGIFVMQLVLVSTSSLIAGRSLLALRAALIRAIQVN